MSRKVRLAADRDLVEIARLARNERAEPGDIGLGGRTFREALMRGLGGPALGQIDDIGIGFGAADEEDQAIVVLKRRGLLEQRD